MKKSLHHLFILCVLSIIPNFLSAQKLTKKNEEVILSNFVPVSSANYYIDGKSVTVNKDVYFGKYEISNEAFQEFLAWQKGKDSTLFEKYYPNKLEWDNPTTPTVPSRSEYFFNPRFRNFPVVNVTYDAAVAYCNWLSSLYNSIEGRKFKKVKFRLPTEIEWVSAANGGMQSQTYPFGRYLHNSKGEALCNYLRVGDENIGYEPATKNYVVMNAPALDGAVTSPVDSFSPYNGLYNMSGNVAEMLSEEGIAKGGSFMDPGYDVAIASKVYFVKCAPNIGFRVVMEVLSL